LAFHSRFHAHFQGRTRSVVVATGEYLKGLMQADRKNMERMEEAVKDGDEQRLQHMLTNSAWDHRAVLDQVAMEADARLGGSAESGLLIDESGFAKKGAHSVGVARQWCGRLGKVDNCQVGVFAALGRGHLAAVTDVRLFLPAEWASDRRRCEVAGIPPEHRQSKSKAALALEMVRHQRALGVRFAWVGVDGGYGKEPEFLRALEDLGETFVADVHKDQRIYLRDPEPRVPEGGRGRPPSRPRAQSPAERVDRWAAAQPPEAWQRVVLRDSTAGRLEVDILHRHVWLWDSHEAQARHWHLLVRREIGSPDTVKYTLSNAAADTPPHRLAQMQAQRFWIERAFQEAKSECGMADYQARKWRSWHHHMALVAMTLLFMIEERIAQRDAYPLLSCSDIETLLRHFLPRRDLDPHEVIRQMEKRHAKRRAVTEARYTAQDLPMPDSPWDAI
jgi:SRSO17 transposase